MSGPRLSANERVQRLLTMVPWIAAHDGPTLREVCDRFGLTRAQLLADLDVVFMVGLYPFTPDELIDVIIEQGRVWIRLAPYFERPLRLTPEDGLALVAAGQSLAAVQGAEADGPLQRGLAKVAAVLGLAEEVNVSLGEAGAGLLTALRDAVDRRHQVELDYYTYGRDERTTRVVDPYRVFADQGQWYLAAFCHLAEDERLFRVDRVARVTELTTTFERQGEASQLGVYSPRPTDPRVTLDLEPEAHWVAEQYPIEARETLADGTLRVRLAISAEGWLERLLVRLGPLARVVEAGPPLSATLGRAAAARIAARYRR